MGVCDCETLSVLEFHRSPTLTSCLVFCMYTFMCRCAEIVQRMFALQEIHQFVYTCVT